MNFEGYGLPMAVATAVPFLLTWMEFKVMKARKLAGVPYPNMYATAEEANQDTKKLLFNCAQRVHQNTLEKIPSFLITLGLGALSSPFYAGIFGELWLIGRIAYAFGYYTGNPKSRNGFLSSLTYVGIISLSVLSMKTVYSHFIK